MLDLYTNRNSNGNTNTIKFTVTVLYLGFVNHIIEDVDF